MDQFYARSNSELERMLFSDSNFFKFLKQVSDKDKEHKKKHEKTILTISTMFVAKSEEI